ncbi:MarR family winged helix-turn-helix transcriptional regulator [Nocardiopsis lambiniae]|uniref:MarR family winged helix-turn-helix transcriptional regulator n=1 Tax=Nocardiopsis lambiniae TaxID=3075539 RepID=A0ABU2M2R5_9ACTN|nr:MarR family winged helix-turn-helix transcriptional regulator [Nocardiopsis sp. DSM 44743]MDT0326912.1 MarR family winged helix-turn-helix transcriptional regulator [Nocardiopsis sp. DSM 44743]
MSDAVWLDEEQQRTWRTFLAAVHLLEASLDRQLRRDSGLPHTYYQALAMLSESPGGAMTMTELARLLRSSPSRLSHAAARLEEDDLIRRFRRPGDRRTTIVELTERGFRTLEKAAPGHVAHVRRILFDVIDPEQAESLRAIAEAMLGALDPEGVETRYAPPGSRD